MKVILKQDIKGIGRKYEVKNIADGYANNFLLPKKLAEYASPEVVKKYEALRKAHEAEQMVNEDLAKKQVETLKSVTVTLSKKANEKGSLFEKVHETEIAEALKEQAHIMLDAGAFDMEKPIKQVGTHVVNVNLGKQSGTVNVEVVAL